VSKRSGKRRVAPGVPAQEASEQGRAAEAPKRDARSGRTGVAAQIGIAAAVFLVVTVVAELAGAASLGVAATIGQIAVAVVVLILRGP
jgi:hypothetical protein